MLGLATWAFLRRETDHIFITFSKGWMSWSWRSPGLGEHPRKCTQESISHSSVCSMWFSPQQTLSTALASQWWKRAAEKLSQANIYELLYTWIRKERISAEMLAWGRKKSSIFFYMKLLFYNTRSLVSRTLVDKILTLAVGKMELQVHRSGLSTSIGYVHDFSCETQGICPEG